MKQDTSRKRWSIYVQDKKQCKMCGHKQLVGTRDRVVCAYCGHYIYKDQKTEFKYKLKEIERRRKNNVKSKN